VVALQNKNLRENISKPIFYQNEDVKWTSIKLSEVAEQKYRFEANVFNIESKHARELIKNSTYPLLNLFSGDSFIQSAIYPTRFKRIYVNKQDGIEFYMPSQLLEINPQPTKFISPKTKVNFEELKVNENELLITRSGTIGNITLVSKTLANRVFSDDVIRMRLYDDNDLGYVYSFLKTSIGQLLLKTNNYGSVINHIEPDHLSNIKVPNPSKKLKNQIDELIKESFRLRDESNELIETARKILLTELDLPPIEDIEKEYFIRKDDIENFTVRSKNLSNRFDGSYHHPIVKEILKLLPKKSKEIKLLGDSELSSNIILPGRFKRIYVEEDQGAVFFGGKQILELDPRDKKYLSLTKHSSRIQNELTIHENDILITRSGTIGKVQITPKHWNSFVANEHIIRVVPSNSDIAGYLYTWLNTDYGYELIKRFTYGSVVDEIDNHQLARIQIPILKDPNKIKEINDSVLKANDLRSESYNLDQEAIKIVNEEIIYHGD